MQSTDVALLRGLRLGPHCYACSEHARRSPATLDGVRTFNGRTGELPGEAALYFRYKGLRVLLRSEGAFSVSVDRDDSSRAWHLELEICVVRHRIELCECGSSEQGVIATAKRDDVED